MGPQRRNNTLKPLAYQKSMNNHRQRKHRNHLNPKIHEQPETKQHFAATCIQKSMGYQRQNNTLKLLAYRNLWATRDKTTLWNHLHQKINEQPGTKQQSETTFIQKSMSNQKQNNTPKQLANKNPRTSRDKATLWSHLAYKTPWPTRDT